MNVNFAKTDRITAIMVFLFFLSAICWAGGKKETDTKPTPQVQQQQVQQIQPTQPIQPPPPPVSKYFTGDGGKGISIAILAPKATGLTENQNYLPTLLQGEFVSNFTSYSAISVLDRERLDKQYAELLSGYYDDNAQAGLDLGHLTPTDYIMGGNITRTATGYALQMQITKTADKMTVASYSGTCTFVELDNLTGIRRASLELLQKMGVTLTTLAQGELTRAETENRVNAQTALARGITAQNSGTVVEALTYYYQATAFDTSLLEAASRASAISTTITSGNIGENVRNDIQRRNEWKKILDEADAFFQKHWPFEILYDPTLTQGSVDYNKGTVDLSFKLLLIPNDTAFKVLTNIREGLISTGKKNEWGFGSWPLSSNPSLFSPYVRFLITAVLINSEGKQIAFEQKERRIGVGVSDVLPNRGGRQTVYVVEDSSRNPQPFMFNSVKANDITDTLTIQITRVSLITHEEGNSVIDPAKQGDITIRTGSLPQRR